ncbi:hypothetical protein KEM52_002785, partial [Ascosphaera acerosa]
MLWGCGFRRREYSALACASGSSQSVQLSDLSSNQVSFSYAGRPEVLILDSVSLHFRPDRLTFIVGASGSGKSTIGSLLAGFYQRQSGSITIDGVDLSNISTDWLRSNILVVQQNPALSDDTLRNNLSMGCPNSYGASLSQLLRAIQFASLEQILLKLSDGVESHMGLEGASLSVGEVQRVSLARARIRDPPILVLDEPTSSLDCTTRDTIMRNIREWRKGKTTVIVTHDINHIGPDDVVYRIEKGHVKAGMGLDSMGQLSNAAVQSSKEPLIMSPDVYDRRHSRQISCGGIIRRSSLWQWPASRLAGAMSPLTRVSSRSPEMGEWPLRNHWQRSPRIRPARFTSPAIRFNCPVYAHNYEMIDSGAQKDIDEHARMFLSSEGHKISDSCHRWRDTVATPQLSRWTMTPQTLQDARFQQLRKATLASVNADQPMLAQTLQDPRDTRPMSLVAILRSVPGALDLKRRAMLAWGVTCICVHAVALPVFSHLFGLLLGTYSDKSSSDARLRSISIMILAAVDALAQASVIYCLEGASAFWTNKCRSDAIQGILRQSKAWFAQEHHEPSSLCMVLDRF